MTDLDSKYLSREDLYRAACAPRFLPHNFIDSLWFRLIQDEDQMPTERGDDVRSSPKDMALRAAVGLAREWREAAEGSRRLGHAEHGDSRSGVAAERNAAQNHQAIYCANTLLRHIAQELYRHLVPREERVL